MVMVKGMRDNQVTIQLDATLWQTCEPADAVQAVVGAHVQRVRKADRHNKLR